MPFKDIGQLTNVKGDATDPQKLVTSNEICIIPHCCNDEGGWGKGFVLALSKKWTAPEAMYRAFMAGNKAFPTLGKVCIAKIDNDIAVANMIGQAGIVSEDNPKPVKYWALAMAMREVAGYIDMLQSKTMRKVVIHCPKFGSDLAMGDWNFILELIRECWLEEGIDVVVYEYNG